MTGAAVQGGEESELEVGAVLRPGMSLDLGAAGDGLLDVGGVGGVEVAHDEVGPASEDGRVPQPRVGGDHERGPGQLESPTGGYGIAAREDDSGVDLPAGGSHAAPFARAGDGAGRAEAGRCTLRRHDPDQVRTVGGCVPSLSARRTGLPC